MSADVEDLLKKLAVQMSDVISPADIDLLKQQLLAETRQDHVGLWSLLWDISQRLPKSTASDRRRIAMAIVSDLLAKGNIIAGWPSADGRAFNPIAGNDREVLRKIRASWEELGREPKPGEVVWFTTPD